MLFVLTALAGYGLRSRRFRGNQRGDDKMGIEEIGGDDAATTVELFAFPKPSALTTGEAGSTSEEPKYLRVNQVPLSLGISFDKGQWTDLTITALDRLWELGFSSQAIGLYLGFTKNAVVGKTHRLDLPKRPNPIKRTTIGPPTRRTALRRVDGPTLPPLASAIVTEEMADATQVFFPVITARPVVKPVTPRPMLVDFRSSAPRPVPPLPAPTRTPSGKCRFPMWGDGKPSHIYCDKPIARGSYCAECAARCYVRVGSLPGIPA